MESNSWTNDSCEPVLFSELIACHTTSGVWILNESYEPGLFSEPTAYSQSPVVYDIAQPIESNSWMNDTHEPFLKVNQ